MEILITVTETSVESHQSDKADSELSSPINTANISASDDATDILTVAGEEQRMWEDDLNEKQMEGIHLVPSSSQSVDSETMCIQQLVGRLIAKAEHLQGMQTCICV